MEELSEDSNSPEVLKERKTVFENYRKLFESPLLADFEFNVKGVKILAHKVVLAAQTEYYRELFTADLEEAKTGKVEITDFDPDVIRIMLEFIYKGEVFNASEKFGTHAEDLIKAADKYRIDGLRKKCEKFIVRNRLNAETVVDFFILALKHNAPYLKENAYAFMIENLNEVKKTKGWSTGKNHQCSLGELVNLSLTKRPRLSD